MVDGGIYAKQKLLVFLLYTTGMPLKAYRQIIREQNWGELINIIYDSILLYSINKYSIYILFQPTTLFLYYMHGEVELIRIVSHSLVEHRPFFQNLKSV